MQRPLVCGRGASSGRVRVSARGDPGVARGGRSRRLASVPVSESDPALSRAASRGHDGSDRRSVLVNGIEVWLLTRGVIFLSSQTTTRRCQPGGLQRIASFELSLAALDVRVGAVCASSADPVPHGAPALR